MGLRQIKGDEMQHFRYSLFESFSESSSEDMEYVGSFEDMYAAFATAEERLHNSGGDQVTDWFALSGSNQWQLNAVDGDGFDCRFLVLKTRAF